MSKLLTGYQDMVGLLNIHKVARLNTQVNLLVPYFAHLKCIYLFGLYTLLCACPWYTLVFRHLLLQHLASNGMRSAYLYRACI